MIVTLYVVSYHNSTQPCVYSCDVRVDLYLTSVQYLTFVYAVLCRWCWWWNRSFDLASEMKLAPGCILYTCTIVYITHWLATAYTYPLKVLCSKTIWTQHNQTVVVIIAR